MKLLQRDADRAQHAVGHGHRAIGGTRPVGHGQEATSGFVGMSCSAADYGPLVRHALAHFATRDPFVHVSGAIEARVEASAGRRSKKASGSA